MRVLPDTITLQKNKISTAGAWLTCIELTYTGETTLRFVNNNANVVIPGTTPIVERTYTKWAFGLGQVKESIKGELPRISLALYDVDLTLRTTMQANSGWSGGEVTVRRVFVDSAGTVTDTDIVQYFTILSTTWDDTSNALNFSIGISTPLSKRFPRDRQSATICRHKFRDGFCRYAEGTDPLGRSIGEFTSNKIAIYSAPGARDYIRMWSYASFMLDIDDVDTPTFSAGQHIMLTGSNHNDNKYIVDELNWGDEEGYTRLYLNNTSIRVNQNENSSHALTLTVLSVCDHSITDCRALNNSHKFGASPGMSGGLYG